MTRAQILAALKAIHDAAEAETRNLTPEELTKFSELESQLEALDQSTAARQRYSRYIKPQHDLPVPDDDNHDIHDEATDPKLRAAFAAYLRTGQSNSDISAYAGEPGGMRFEQSEAVPSAGGYTVPDAVFRPMKETRKRFGGVAAFAETITTTDGRPIPWVTADDTANGDTVEIVAEGARSTTGADMEFGLKQLGAYKYRATGKDGLPLRISWELIQDSNFDIVAYVDRKLSERIARRQALDWAAGTGTGMPQGISRIVPAQNLLTGNAITYGALVDLTHGLDPDYRDSARFLLNDKSAATIEKILDLNGRPLLLPLSDGSLSGPNSTRSLLGYPVTIDQGLGDIRDATGVLPGTIGDPFVIFADVNTAYVIRYVSGITVIADPYERKMYGQMTYEAWARADGMIQDPNAIVGLGGFSDDV